MKKYLALLISAILVVTALFLIVGCESKDKSSNQKISDNQNTSGNVNLQETTPVNAKGGWKYLTWGMSIDQVNNLLVKNGMKTISLQNGQNPRDNNEIDFVDKRGLESSEISRYGWDYLNSTDKDYYQKYGRRDFYFLRGMLEAVRIYFTGSDNNAVADQLKKDFPDGKVTESAGIKDFSYFNNNINVYIESQGGWGFGYIWYVNPYVEKFKNEVEATEKQAQEKKSEERAKNIVE